MLDPAQPQAPVRKKCVNRSTLALNECTGEHRTLIFKVTALGNMIGRQESEWGQIGVKQIPSTC